MTTPRLYSIPISRQLLFFLILFFIFIEISVLLPSPKIDPFSDLGNYQRFWNDISAFDIRNGIFPYEPGFVIFTKIISYLFSFSIFLWIIKFSVFYSFFLFAFTLYRNIFAALCFSLIVFFFFPPLVSVANLVIRQGLAIAFLFFYFSRISINTVKLVNVTFFFIFLTCFHYSAIFVLIGFLIFRLVKNIYAFYSWCIANILYFFNFPGMFGEFLYKKIGFKVSALDVISENSTSDYVIGFKSNFFMISASFVIVPIIFSLFNFLKISRKELLTLPLFRFYLILNSLCVFTSLMPFHDRFFIWSWVFGPLLIISTLNFSKYTVKLL